MLEGIEKTEAIIAIIQRIIQAKKDGLRIKNALECLDRRQNEILFGLLFLALLGGAIWGGLFR